MNGKSNVRLFVNFNFPIHQSEKLYIGDRIIAKKTNIVMIVFFKIEEIYQ